MIDVWFAVAFFLFIMGAVIAGGYIFVLRGAVTEGPSLPGTIDPALPVRTQTHWVRLFAVIGGWMPGARKTENPIRRQLIAAGFMQPSALAAFYGLKCAAGLGCAAALAVATAWAGSDRTLVPVLGGAGFGYLLPARFLRRAVTQRRQRLRRALPTALDLCSLSLEAGQALDQSILDTSRGLRRSYPDLSTELHLLHLETRASNNRTEALRNLGRRTGEPEIRKLAALLTDAERFGTSIAPSLRTHARYLRIRLRQAAQESARKVGVKLVFPVFFLIFPSVILMTLGPALMMVTGQLRTMLGG
jgi:tight adherence protein C